MLGQLGAGSPGEEIDHHARPGLSCQRDEQLDRITAPRPRLRPMLAVAAKLPEGDRWAYEMKWDGIRAIVYAYSGQVRAYSRNDKEITASFPELAPIGGQLGEHSAVLDGEIVAFDDHGRPSFSRLQRRLNLSSAAAVAQRSREVPVSYVVFDLMQLDGASLLDLAYAERRSRLEALQLTGPTVAVPQSFQGVSGEEVLRAAGDAGLEGLVAKRRDSRYHPGQRSDDWRKVKLFRTQEVVIGAWTSGKGARAGSLGALLLGIDTPAGFAYIGKVGTGFDTTARSELLEMLGPLERKTSPFVNPLSRTAAHEAHFVRPSLVGEVKYAEWTGDRRLRHPSWRGLRPDKDPSEVTLEPRAH